MAKKDKKIIKNSKDKTSFIKSFKAELKKVIWPTPKQLFNNTVAVLAIVLITSLIVFVLDLSFESINKYGIDKVKQVVTNSVDNNNINQENETLEDNGTTESNEKAENVNSNNVNTENTNNVTENVNNE